jgi:hypothetical protein
VVARKAPGGHVSPSGGHVSLTSEAMAAYGLIFADRRAAESGPQRANRAYLARRRGTRARRRYCCPVGASSFTPSMRPLWASRRCARAGDRWTRRTRLRRGGALMTSALANRQRELVAELLARGSWPSAHCRFATTRRAADRPAAGTPPSARRPASPAPRPPTAQRQRARRAGLVAHR